jgi:prepilin-type N-terminal cleavage/methylation domain-containing protein
MHYVRKDNLGFTLVELIMVLIIGAATMAIATPPIARAFRNTATQSAADEFVTTHALAKSAAIRFGRTAELHIDTSKGEFFVKVDTADTGNSVRISLIKDMSKYRVEMTSTRSVICFDARGLPTSRGTCEAADATLTFTAGDDYEELSITALGRILR